MKNRGCNHDCSSLTNTVAKSSLLVTFRSSRTYNRQPLFFGVFFWFFGGFFCVFFVLQTKVASRFEKLRGHLCICCFGSCRMWSVVLETVPSDSPAAPWDALPGRAESFKAGWEAQASRAAPEESQCFQRFFCLVFFYFFVLFPA